MANSQGNTRVLELISKFKIKKRMIELRKLARTQLMSIEKLNNTGINSLEEKSKK